MNQTWEPQWIELVKKHYLEPAGIALISNKTGKAPRLIRSQAQRLGLSSPDRRRGKNLPKKIKVYVKPIYRDPISVDQSILKTKKCPRCGDRLFEERAALAWSGCYSPDGEIDLFCLHGHRFQFQGRE
jgi:hypothetical protein